MVLNAQNVNIVVTDAPSKRIRVLRFVIRVTPCPGCATDLKSTVYVSKYWGLEIDR
ncbi:hypothetical protein K2173_013780 [Erythroxylum novogranatense]|uniref:Uncharacterized protein n=1 Tax=Erythroxylum novogranatense TaxID=1862640 RepID=A0AAV8SD19_9ROSI|nr:hypothetical protein K2173_013780 [Erythroxylum novogranatense]